MDYHEKKNHRQDEFSMSDNEDSLGESVQILLTRLGLEEEEVIRCSEYFIEILAIFKGDIWNIVEKAQSKGINPIVTLDLLNISIRCSRVKDEGKSITTGFIVGNPDEIFVLLTNTLYTASYDGIYFKPDYWDKLVNIVIEVNRTSAIIVIDGKSGLISGIRKTDPELDDNYRSLTEQCNCIGLYIGVMNFFRIYSDGNMSNQVIINRNTGEWVNRKIPEIEEQLACLSEEKSLDSRIIITAFRIAMLGSERSIGGSFYFSNIEDISRLTADSLEERDPKTISNIARDDVFSYMSRDGAVVLNQHGILHGVGVKFAVRGGRRNAALAVTKEVISCCAIVVRQDGNILVYQDGRIIFSI